MSQAIVSNEKEPEDLAIKLAPYLALNATSLELAFRLAQDKIKSQMENARGADSRSQALMTVCSGFSGAAVTAAISAHQYEIHPLVPAAIAAGIIWVAGALLAIIALRPVIMVLPGWEPSRLLPEPGSPYDHHALLAELTYFSDININANHNTLLTNSRFAGASMCAVLIAPVVGGVLAWFGASSC